VATLTVWKFDSPQGAENMHRVLNHLQNEGLVVIHDAAWVEWELGKRKPTTHQRRSSTGADAAAGGMWGLVLGLIFFVPLLGVTVGAALGALAGSLTDVGIDDDFIRTVRSEVTPGTSALFLLTSGAVRDKLMEHFPPGHLELISTSLSDEEEAKLRELLEEWVG